jgi:hypothetical protein
VGSRELGVAEPQRSYLDIFLELRYGGYREAWGIELATMDNRCSSCRRSHTLIELIALWVKCGALDSTPISCQLFPEAVA